LTKHELEVQFKVIQVFSSVNIAKTFWIKDFFEDYSVKLTNQQKTNLRSGSFVDVAASNYSCYNYTSKQR